MIGGGTIGTSFDHLAIICIGCGVIVGQLVSPLVLLIFRMRHVTRIIDGDTIEIRGNFFAREPKRVTLRLNRIDASDKEPAKTEATKFLQQKIKRIIKVKILSRDKYGRTLAEVFYPFPFVNININNIMVKSGHAKYYDGGRRG